MSAGSAKVFAVTLLLAIGVAYGAGLLSPWLWFAALLAVLVGMRAVGAHRR